jgi:hypothetical protein
LGRISDIGVGGSGFFSEISFFRKNGVKEIRFFRKNGVKTLRRLRSSARPGWARPANACHGAFDINIISW